MQPLYNSLKTVFLRERRASGLADAFARVAGALRALVYRREHQELLSLDVFKRCVSAAGDADALFYLSHHHYLSSRLGLRERFDCALTHYRYEGEHYEGYVEALYGCGIRLWTQIVERTRYTMVDTPI